MNSQINVSNIPALKIPTNNNKNQNFKKDKKEEKKVIKVNNKKNKKISVKYQTSIQVIIYFKLILE